jgi:hypothetical protein
MCYPVEVVNLSIDTNLVATDDVHDHGIEEELQHEHGEDDQCHEEGGAGRVTYDRYGCLHEVMGFELALVYWICEYLGGGLG